MNNYLSRPCLLYVPAPVCSSLKPHISRLMPVSMHPSRCRIEATSFGPDLVRRLLPPAVVDSILSALSFGHHCELTRFSQVERRWAVAANNHVVIDLQHVRLAKPLRNIATEEHLLPKRMARLQRTANPMQFGVPSLGSSLDTFPYRCYRSARWQIQNCDDAFHFQSTFLNPCLRSAALKNTGRCRL